MLDLSKLFFGSTSEKHCNDILVEISKSWSLLRANNSQSFSSQCNERTDKMSNYQDHTPNPLRPYYKPPSIGFPQDTPGTTSSGTHGLGPKNGSAASYASSARDMFSELDYGDYLTESSPTAFGAVKEQVDDWFYKYMSVMLSQPFDVAKMVLQVRSLEIEDVPSSVAGRGTGSRQSSYREAAYSDVWIANSCQIAQAKSSSSILQMTQIQTSLLTLLPLHPFHIHILLQDLEGDVIANTLSPRPSRKLHYLPPTNLLSKDQTRYWTSLGKNGRKRVDGESGKAQILHSCITFWCKRSRNGRGVCLRPC